MDVIVPFDYLCGMHSLSAVEIKSALLETREPIKHRSSILLTLDGVTYKFLEILDDKDKSFCCKEIFVCNEQVKMSFSPVKVICSMMDTREGDGIILRNALTGKNFFEIGTKGIGTLFSYFWFQYLVENMT